MKPMRENRMYVVKRSGDKEYVYFDQISTRNEKFCEDLDVDPIRVSQKVIDGLYSGIKTTEIDRLSAETALFMSTHKPDYEILSKRILVSNLHKITTRDFSRVTETLNKLGMLDDSYYAFVKQHSFELDSIPIYERDYDFTSFGFKTLEKSYLLQDENNKTVERPQHMWMRVATFLRMPDIGKIKEVYDLLSQKYFIHASPTLFNCGRKHSQLSSCFLLSMKDDLQNMLSCFANAGMISKWAGGIGVNFSMVRSRGSRINGTGGESTGIVPFMKLWNDLSRYVDQGGKRKGAIAMFLEPHHPDIKDFLKTRKNNTKDEDRCLDLHIGLWIPDLFMKRLKEDGMWSLFDPNTVKDLHKIYGEEYESVYLKAEKEKLYTEQLKAKDLWKEILIAQMETGEPYILFKDHINRKNAQMNRGVIRGSNLCCEILEYTDENNYAVCNLASISLPALVKSKEHDDRWVIYSKENCPYCSKAVTLLECNKENYEIIKASSKDDLPVDILSKIGDHKTFPMIFLNNEFIGGCDKLIEMYSSIQKLRKSFDYKKLGEITELITENMNIVIDKNYYPVPQAYNSNMEMRPTGIGIQGLADVLQMLDITWESQEAKDINTNVYAVIYFHALKKSMELSKIHGPYKYFEGSPASKGILQPDMWNITPTTVNGLLDWDWLKQEIKTHGLRNSLLIAQMPNASTAHILGNNECFEPYTSNMYNRRVLSGEFPIINQHLYRKLKSLNLWNDDIVNNIIENEGSIQSIKEIPKYIKDVFRTVWEIPVKTMVNYAIARGPYIDQTQSFNVFMESPDTSKLSSMFMYEWENGLKTGMYYLRRKPKAKAVKFTLMKNMIDEKKEEECTSCSS